MPVVPASLQGIVPLPKPSTVAVALAGTSSATQQEDWDSLPPLLKPKLTLSKYRQLSARLANTGMRVAGPARKV